eukprot:1854934-Amphidinium_carterae.1
MVFTLAGSCQGGQICLAMARPVRETGHAGLHTLAIPHVILYCASGYNLALQCNNVMQENLSR